MSKLKPQGNLRKISIIPKYENGSEKIDLITKLKTVGKIQHANFQPGNLELCEGSRPRQRAWEVGV